MKKLFVLLLVIILLSLTGCKGKDTLKEEKRIENFASENSEKLCKEYIEQKYGIQAEFIAYMLEDEYQMFYSLYTGTVACKMEYQSKEFFVLYDVDDIEDIRDNFEEDLITRNIINYLQEECDLKEYQTINIKYTEKGTYGDFVQESSIFQNGKEKDEECWEFKNCFNHYYDGNIEGFFLNCSSIMISARLEVESISDFNLENKKLLDSDYVFISLYNHKKDSNVSDLNDVDFNLREHLSIYKSSDGKYERDYTKLDIEKVDKFEILYNATYGAFEDNVDVLDSSAIVKEGYEVISPIFRGKGEGYIDGSIIAKIQIKDLQDVYVLKYYDTDNLEDRSVSNYQNPEKLYNNCNVVFLRKVK